MFEYKLVDFRTPQLKGVEQRGDLESFEQELAEETEGGWRVCQVVGGPTDERLLFLFERPAPD